MPLELGCTIRTDIHARGAYQASWNISMTPQAVHAQVTAKNAPAAIWPGMRSRCRLCCQRLMRRFAPPQPGRESSAAVLSWLLLAARLLPRLAGIASATAATPRFPLTASEPLG